MQALGAVTGGGGMSASSAATATGRSGDLRSGDVGGISSPIVIGGFKSDGSATAASMPQWMWVVAALVGGFLLYRIVMK